MAQIRANNSKYYYYFQDAHLNLYVHTLPPKKSSEKKPCVNEWG